MNKVLTATVNKLVSLVSVLCQNYTRADHLTVHELFVQQQTTKYPFIAHSTFYFMIGVNVRVR